MVKRFLAILMAVIVLPVISVAQGLKRLSLDDASAVTPKIQVDGKVKTEGKGSIRITTEWPTTVCLGEVAGLGVENAALMYKTKVKSDLDGVALLEMWVHAGGSQYFSKGMDNTVSQQTDWRTIQTPFMFGKGQKPDKATLNLVINGIGTI